jgi:hypothetical protein
MRLTTSRDVRLRSVGGPCIPAPMAALQSCLAAASAGMAQALEAETRRSVCRTSSFERPVNVRSWRKSAVAPLSVDPD